MQKSPHGLLPEPHILQQVVLGGLFVAGLLGGLVGWLLDLNSLYAGCGQPQGPGAQGLREAIRYVSTVWAASHLWCGGGAPMCTYSAVSGWGLGKSESSREHRAAVRWRFPGT